MKHKLYIVVAIYAALQFFSTNIYAASAVEMMFDGYRKQGATEFDAKAGQQLWNQKFSNNKASQPRSCASCHSSNLASSGKHIRTGKLIEPMAPSVNANRLTDVKKIGKWFKRNCKWTLGRECSAQEQGNVLTYLKDL